MRLTLTNFRAIAAASLDVGQGIVLCAGKNGAGKSTIAMALASLVGPHPLPLGLKKIEGGKLVRSGAGAAHLELTWQGGSVGLTFPNGERSAEGNPPRVSAYAAGIDSLLDRPIKDRTTVLADYLEIDPTKDEVTRHLAACGVETADIERLWTALGINGWDATAKSAAEKGANLKGRWEQVTNANYGSAKALSWRPDGWLPQWENIEPAVAEVALKSARERKEALVATRAVDTSEVERLRKLAAALPDRQAALGERRAALNEAQDSLTKATDAHDALPAGEPNKGMPCPHCRKAIVAIKVNAAVTKYEKAAEVDEATLAEQRKVKGQAHGRMMDARRAADAARDALNLADADVRESLRAQQDAGKVKTSTVSDVDVQKAVDAVAQAETVLKAVTARQQAEVLAETIALNQQIVDMLKPEGLRKTKLQLALTGFNASLARLCKTAGWEPVALHPDLSFTYGGFPPPLASSGEQYRIRAAVQVAMALIDQSEIVILDATDTLDKAGKNGLFRILMAESLPALVCIKADAPDEVPDLAANGVGATWWVEGGAVHPLAEAAEAAEAASNKEAA